MAVLWHHFQHNLEASALCWGSAQVLVPKLCGNNTVCLFLCECPVTTMAQCQHLPVTLEVMPSHGNDDHAATIWMECFNQLRINGQQPKLLKV